MSVDHLVFKSALPSLSDFEAIHLLYYLVITAVITVDYRFFVNQNTYTQINKTHSSLIMPSEPSRGGAESPDPETLSGKQIHDTPGSGVGTDDATNKEQTNKAGLEVCHLHPSHRTARNNY